MAVEIGMQRISQNGRKSAKEAEQSNAELELLRNHERSVLAYLGTYPGACEKMYDVCAADFENSLHRTFFNAIAALHFEHSVISDITLTEHLRSKRQLEKVGGAPGVTGLLNTTTGPEIARDALTRMREARVKRAAADIAEGLRKGDCELSEAIEALQKLDGPKSWTNALNESVVTASELRELQLRPRRKLLGDWFCEGDLGFIFAFRGVGKTWLALAIAQALSSGGKLGEWQAQEEVRVLYVDGEMPPDLMRDRCEGLQASNDNLEFLNHEILFDRTGKALNITNREVQQAITQRCIASAVKVLILDNLSTLASGMKENEADDWELVNNWLLDLRRRKIAVVIVHHAGRSGEMRGTSKREDNVFWIIALDDARKNSDDNRGARFISHFTKPSRNTQEEISAYKWHFVTESSGRVTIAHEKAQTLDVFRQIIEAGVTKCDQIAAEMKIPNYAVSRLAKKAQDAGWLTKSDRGEYVLKKAQK